MSQSTDRNAIFKALIQSAHDLSSAEIKRRSQRIGLKNILLQVDDSLLAIAQRASLNVEGLILPLIKCPKRLQYDRPTKEYGLNWYSDATVSAPHSFPIWAGTLSELDSLASGSHQASFVERCRETTSLATCGVIPLCEIDSGDYPGLRGRLDYASEHGEDIALWLRIGQTAASPTRSKGRIILSWAKNALRSPKRSINAHSPQSWETDDIIHLQPHLSRVKDTLCWSQEWRSPRRHMCTAVTSDGREFPGRNDGEEVSFRLRAILQDSQEVVTAAQAYRKRGREASDAI